MNVWDYAMGAKPRNHKPEKTMKTPRTRDGKDYPGGKHMRRALKALGIRKRVLEGQKSKQGETVPGSMKGK